MATASGTGTWTRRFVAASAVAAVGWRASALVGLPRETRALAAVFGFVCPMAFGMAYLLVPSYLGRTLVADGLAGVHFVLAFAGAVPIVAASAVDVPRWALRAGVLAWSLGVLVFVGALVASVGPALFDPAARDRIRRVRHPAGRYATLLLPVPLLYLLAGTALLVARHVPLAPPVPASTPRVLHLYAAGFAALLVFALGMRLLAGFFHATPSTPVAAVVLGAGALGPALLAAFLWGGAPFRVGAAVEASAMVGYGVVVAGVARETQWSRVGLTGVVFGAAAGVLAVVVAAGVAAGLPLPVDAHVRLVLDGFFALTVVGYAVQFFPLTRGDFAGASDRTARAIILTLVAGVGLAVAGVLADVRPLVAAGDALGVCGMATYAYVVLRVFAGD